MLRIISNIIYQITFFYSKIFLNTFYKIKKLFVKERRLPTLPLSRLNRNVNYNDYWIPNNNSTYLNTERRWNTNNNSGIWTDGEWIGGTWDNINANGRQYNSGEWNTTELLDKMMKSLDCEVQIQKRKNKIDNLYKDDEL